MKNIQISDPIHIAIIGLNFGEELARHIIGNVPYLKIEAVCDLDMDRARCVAQKLGVSALTFDELLADQSIEAVGLFTGPVERLGLAEKILKSGRHILTTKPFSLDSAGAERLLGLAYEKGLVIHLNSPGPCKTEDQLIIDKLQNDYSLGRPVAFHGETWAHYREKAGNSWYDDPKKCPAAPIFRLGVYLLNDFAPIVGDPEQVHVMESRLFTERPTSDQAILSLRYQNGSLGTIFASFCVDDGRAYQDSVTINYVNGTLSRWIIRNPGSFMESDHAVISLKVKDSAPLLFETKKGGFAGWYNWEAFYDSIRQSKGTPMDQIESVLLGVKLLEAIRDSSLLGSPVRIRNGKRLNFPFFVN